MLCAEKQLNQFSLFQKACIQVVLFARCLKSYVLRSSYNQFYLKNNLIMVCAMKQLNHAITIRSCYRCFRRMYLVALLVVLYSKNVLRTSDDYPYFKNNCTVLCATKQLNHVIAIQRRFHCFRGKVLQFCLSIKSAFT